MKTWRHIVVRQKANLSYGEYEYSIREDFGDHGYTSHPIAPTGGSLEDLKFALEKILDTVNDAIEDPKLVLEE